MHSLIWQLFQLLIRNARDLHDPSLATGPDDNPEYTRGQVNLIMDTVGLAGNDDIHEILVDVLTYQIGEIEALIKIQHIVRDNS